ncbi:hypothetical protein SHKM778_05490 [Streptomyces sp. KM77-8]|uniref:Pyrrolo-quinoline quinone repeat domain-containing protein n=1 Tax=Streptomyces haneummycinicus TaxID=3074435 RepID=A0AAT9H9U6_9ACTN
MIGYTPETGATRRTALSTALEQAQGTVHEGIAHLMATGGTLTAVDLEAGEQLWSLETGLTRGSAPVSDGRHVYLTAPDGRLLAVDARSGRLAGHTPSRLGEAGTVAAALPAPVVADGRVYASAPDGTVFAVNGRDPGAW